MRNLLHQYFNIAFLMGKPQDLPVGPTQMQIGIAFALVSYVVAVAVPFGLSRAFLQALIDIVSTGVVLWIALGIVGHSARFEQAFGGLCGAATFVNLTALFIFLFQPDPVLSDRTTTALADFVLLVWSLSLMAHVVRHAFEVRMFVSIIMSVAFFIVLATITSALWPLPTSSSIDSEKISLLESQADLPMTIRVFSIKA